MTKIVMVNGWASDRRVWNNLSGLLNDYDIEYYDFGYTGNANTNIDFNDAIVVNHSLGVIHSYNHIKQTGQKPKCFINIGGFTRFSACDDFNGVNVRILQRMQKKLNADINSTLADFHNNAGCDGLFENANWNVEKINQGMDYLINADVRDLRNELQIPEYNIWGDNDQIVSKQMTEDSFDNCKVLENGSHFIQIQMVQQCSEFILENV